MRLMTVLVFEFPGTMGACPDGAGTRKVRVGAEDALRVPVPQRRVDGAEPDVPDRLAELLLQFLIQPPDRVNDGGISDGLPIPLRNVLEGNRALQDV